MVIRLSLAHLLSLPAAQRPKPAARLMRIGSIFWDLSGPELPPTNWMNFIIYGRLAKVMADALEDIVAKMFIDGSSVDS